MKERRLNTGTIKDISLLMVSGKIYADGLVDIVHRLTKKLIGNEKGGFRSRKGCVGLILF